MRLIRLKKNQKGLTLIELMFSMFLLAVTVITSFYVLTAAHHMSEASRGRLLALNAARSIMEQIKETPLTAVPAINAAQFISPELRNGAAVITTNPANLAGVQVATVTVTVNWTGPRNRPSTIQFTTMRSRF